LGCCLAISATKPLNPSSLISTHPERLRLRFLTLGRFAAVSEANKLVASAEMLVQLSRNLDLENS